MVKNQLLYILKHHNCARVMINHGMGRPCSGSFDFMGAVCLAQKYLTLSVQSHKVAKFTRGDSTSFGSGLAEGFSCILP